MKLKSNNILIFLCFLEMVETGKLILEPSHKRTIILGEALLYLTFYFSLLVPFFVTMALMHPIEPTHILIKEWFEIEFRFSLQLLPFIILIWTSIFLCSSVVTLQNIVVVWIYVLHTISLERFTPERVNVVREGRLCDLNTPGFGTVSDNQVILFYRVQQILNVFLNEYFRSVLVSFHHVTCLATVVVLVVFTIKYNHILAAEGVKGYIVVAAIIFIPLILVFDQSWMCGNLEDTSHRFKVAGETLLPKKFVFRKFVRSCRLFYVEVVYPFYTIHKETFLLFCAQALDFTIQLIAVQ